MVRDEPVHQHDGHPGDPGDLHGVVGRSPALRAALELTLRVARFPAANVLLVGETGTGKELFARALHNASLNAGEPFVAINCSAIPEALLESELFGHEQGAFTNAHTRKRGLLEVAAEGTLLLDEISELPINLQPKLLRVLEERRVRRLGALAEYPVHCRIVAASNRDLAVAVEDGAFRGDLFYRLNVMRIDLPPVREREGDLPLLVSHFLAVVCGHHALPLKQIAPQALAVLESHEWLGNVRELKNTLESAILRAEGDVILPEHIRIRRRATVPMSGAALLADVHTGGGPPGPPDTAGSTPRVQLQLPPEGITLEDMERQLIRSTLQATAGNRSRAARMLGISRPTILRKIARFDLQDL